MSTGSVAEEKLFEIWQSERSFRFKEEALVNHAPHTPGIYELATFDEQGNGKFVYAGLTTDRSIFDALTEHWDGRREPKCEDLFKKYPNLYFSYVVESNAKSPEDMQDLFWAMMQNDKPELLDWAALRNSGRFASIKVKDKSIL